MSNYEVQVEHAKNCSTFLTVHESGPANILMDVCRLHCMEEVKAITPLSAREAPELEQVVDFWLPEERDQLIEKILKLGEQP